MVCQLAQGVLDIVGTVFLVVARKVLPYIIYLSIFGLCCSRFFLLVFCSLRAEQLRVLGSPAAWDFLKQE